MKVTDAFRICRELMNEHGLHDWSLKWMKSVRILGRCTSAQKLIELNKDYAFLSDEKIVRNTMLHEIAHALTDIEYAGADIKDHGPEWKEIACSIGCTGDRCTKGAVTPTKATKGLATGRPAFTIC